ncbi:MAG: 5-methyltetrahydropteroyltriglutamate--homocysteine S-methyltransferase, partial [Ilumatobacteraceae bacterium]
MATLAPYRADHVGSFLRPQYLIEARQSYRDGKISAEALRIEENRAISEIVKFQEDIGLKGITDGEFRRTYFHVDFLEKLDGVETSGGIQVSFRSKDGNI